MKKTKQSNPKMTKSQKLQSLQTKCTDINFINDCIIKYQQDTKSVVERTLDMCDTVNKIHKKVKGGELEESDLDYFCKSVGLNKNSSTFRKFICISHHSDQFRMYIDRIPSSYSVLYEITTLDSDMFELLVDSNQLNPYLTLREVKKFSNKTANSQRTSEVSLKIEFDINKSSQDTLVHLNDFINLISSKPEIEFQFQNKHIFYRQLSEYEKES